MKVAFCSSPLTSGHQHRGIGTYTKNLVKELKKQKDVQIQEFSDLSGVKDTDVVHFPFFDLFQHTLPLIKKWPMVITIHDVIPLLYPTAYPPGIKGSWNLILQKLALKNVSAVITVSEASKEDIIKYLGVPAEKIYPIGEAPAGHYRKINDSKSLKEVKGKYNLPDKFALYTGNVNWNKNLLNLTEGAIAAGIDLVLVGKSFEEKGNLDHPEMQSFKEFLNHYGKNPQVHILGFVENNDLVIITNLAQVVLLPSFAEGFGLPILEAQICGVPVITSNLSSMPEVAGFGALLIDPGSVESISGAIGKIIKDEKVRDQLIKEGLENVKRFSWEKAAKETVQVYEKIT